MKAPLKVVHVVGSTGLYGAEQWILALLRYLPADRVEGAIVNLVDEPGETSELVRAAAARGLRAIDLYTGGRYNPQAIVNLARLARAHAYGILHSHGHKADLIALAAARLVRATAMSTPHGWSRERDRRLRVYEAIDRRLLRLFDAVCPLSPDLHDGLRRAGVRERRLRTIVNGVDVDAVDSVSPAAGWRPSCTVVGYVGQLIERKNVECLVRAFDDLVAQRHDLRLVVVGDGPRAGALREMAGRTSRVEFAGYRADAVALMKTFDLFVLPSWQEGIPRCLMEAMAARVPVIASDIPGNRELVEHGVTGLLFDPANPADLQRAILATVERPERAKRMAERAREVIEHRFSAARMAGEYTALYEECSRSSS